MKKAIKIILSVFGGLLLLLLVIHLGFNLWIKYKLPGYIQEKTPYQVRYDNLNVDVLSGDISVINLDINTKAQTDSSKPKLFGKVKSVYIGRLGLMAIINNNQIHSSGLRLENPELQILLPKEKTQEKQYKTPVSFENLDIINGKIVINKDSATVLFSAQDLEVHIKNLKLYKTQEGALPFGFEECSLSSKALFYRINDNYSLDAKNVATQNGRLQVQDFEIKPLQAFSIWKKINPNEKQYVSAKISNLNFENISLQKNQLKLSKVLVDQPTIVIRNRKPKKINKSPKSQDFIIDLQDFVLSNGNVVVFNEDGTTLMHGKKIHAHVQGFKMDASTRKEKIPFAYEDYQLSGKDFFYNAGKFYDLKLKSFKLNKSSTDMHHFALQPKVSKAQFVKMVPMEKDYFDVKASRIQTLGLQWTYENKEPNIKVKQVTIVGANVDIFRSKIPKDDPSEKPLYSKLLRSIKFPLMVTNLDLLQSKLVYEEDTPDSNGPGKVYFTHFNMNVKNINSNKYKGQNTKVPITINCRFFDAPMKVHWTFDTGNLQDVFSISGKITNLPVEKINPFIMPYLHVTAKGLFTELNFDFHGNNDGIRGQFRIKHQDLKVSLFDKETRKKKKLLSAVANIAVKSSSKTFPEPVTVQVERNKQRSFFNLFWKGIEDGLKKTLLIVKI